MWINKMPSLRSGFHFAISVSATVVCLHLLSFNRPVRSDDIPSGLSGTWIVIRETLEGRITTFSVGTTIVIEGRTVRSYGRKGELWDSGILSVHKDGKVDRIEITCDNGETPTGILRLHDDTLEFYWGVNRWPTSFEEHCEEGAHYVQFRRVGARVSLAPTGPGDSHPPAPPKVRRSCALRKLMCWRGCRE